MSEAANPTASVADAMAVDAGAQPSGDRAAPRGLFGEVGAFFAIALPMIVSRVGVAAMGIVDGIIVARYSTEQFAVMGSAEAIVARLLDVAMVLATAGLPLAAQARAAGPRRHRYVARVWYACLGLGVLAGLAVLTLSMFGPMILRLLGQPPEIVAASGEVIRILGIGAPAALVALVAAGLLEALGRPVFVAVVVVLANVANAALDLVLVGVLPGTPAMGAEGAAWATTLVRVMLAVVLMLGVATHRDRSGYRLDRRPEPSLWTKTKRIRARGWSASANVAILALLSLGLPVMAGWMGTLSIARINALWLALAPAMIIVWGMADAAGLRISALRGGTRVPGDLRRLGLLLAAVLGGVLAATAAAYLLAPETMVRWAAPDPSVTRAIVPLIGLGLVALAGDTLSALFGSMLRSLGVLRTPFDLHVVTGLLMLPIAGAMAFGMKWGLAGLVGAHAGMAVVRAAALAWMYFRRTAVR